MCRKRCAVDPHPGTSRRRIEESTFIEITQEPKDGTGFHTRKKKTTTNISDIFMTLNRRPYAVFCIPIQVKVRVNSLRAKLICSKIYVRLEKFCWNEISFKVWNKLLRLDCMKYQSPFHLKKLLIIRIKQIWCKLYSPLKWNIQTEGRNY